MTYLQEISKDTQRCFKRVYMQPRLAVPTGTSPNYEYYTPGVFPNGWIEITDYVLDISETTTNIDDVVINEFTQGDFSLTLDNTQQKFAVETNVNSLFYGYLTRHKTKVVVYAGYIDMALGNEYGYFAAGGFINAEDIAVDSDGKINIPVVSPTMALDELAASEINLGYYNGGTATATSSYRLVDSAASFDIGQVGLEVTNGTTGETTTVVRLISTTQLSLKEDIFTSGDTYSFGQTRWYVNQTVSQVVSLIHNMQIKGRYALRPYLPTLPENNPTHNVLIEVCNFEGLTCRDVLTKLAEISNSAYFATATFELRFKTKVPATASVFIFNSQGSDVNILAASNYNEGIKDIYTKITYEGDDPEVTIDEASWTVGDTSSTNKYGQKELTISNEFITTRALKTTICRNTLQQLAVPKETIDLKTKFLPHLQLLDVVTVNYYGVPMKQAPDLWNKSLWIKSLWNTRYGGILLNNALMKIIKITHTPDFTTDLTLKRL